jgi:multidrug efflux system outer membrane protein
MRRRGAMLLLPGMAVLLTGCTAGPNYRRPPVNAPPTYRNAPPGLPSATSLGDEKWWTAFHDPVLENLIRIVIRQSYDVRIAASRILQAQAQLGITRADQFLRSAALRQL